MQILVLPKSLNRIENPEVDPQLYGQLIFDKAGKTIHWKKKVPSINGAGKILSLIHI